MTLKDRLEFRMTDLLDAKKEAARTVGELRRLSEKHRDAVDCLAELYQQAKGTLRMSPQLRGRIARLLKGQRNGTQNGNN